MLANFTTYYDTIGVWIPDLPHRSAPQAAARVRKMFRFLSPEYKGKLAWHAPRWSRSSRPPTLSDSEHVSGQRVGMRLPVGRLDQRLLPVALAPILDNNGTLYRVDAALDIDPSAGIQLDLDAMGLEAPSGNWNTWYMGDFAAGDDLVLAAYSDRPSKVHEFAGGHRVQHVELRMMGDALPTRDPLELWMIDPLDLLNARVDLTGTEPSDTRQRDLLSRLRNNSSEGVSDRELAWALGCSERTISRAIQALERHGFLRIIRRARGHGVRSHYAVNSPPPMVVPRTTASIQGDFDSG